MISRDRALKAAVASIVLVCAVAVIMIAPAKAHGASWSKWSGVVQASCYAGDDEPWEKVTATGKRITGKVRYVAVPVERVVSKAMWSKLDSSQKYRFFYYGERLQIRHGKRNMTVTVQDCGGFASCGGYRNGTWVRRMFDLTPAVSQGLKVGGLGWVRFRYEEVA